MKRLMVRYKVKPEMAAENRRLVEAVFAEANAKGPEGIRFATFMAADGVSCVHVFSNERADGANPPGALDAFKEFQANIRDRCVEAPAPAAYETIGSYRFSGDSLRAHSRFTAFRCLCSERPKKLNDRFTGGCTRRRPSRSRRLGSVSNGAQWLITAP